jgi:DNA helicase-2/ATP-dependent DNA helicase PcrA
MTIHSSKGLEFPIVFITGLEEGMFPHIKSIDEDNLEEERRLFYVAITRAKKLLTLSFSRRGRVFGKYRETTPSRFIKEIPENLTKRASKKKQSLQTSGKNFKLVFHPKFGKGVVKRVDGKGDDAKVTAIFETFGEKTIIKRFLKVLA